MQKRGNVGMEKIAWERLASILICIAFGAILIALGFRFLFPILLPFLIAWAISAVIRPAAKRLGAHFGVSPRFLSVVLLILLLGGAVLLAVISVRRLLFELQDLLERLSMSIGDTANTDVGAVDYFEMLTSKLPLFKRIDAAHRFAAFRERFNTAVTQMIVGAVGSLSRSLPSFLGKVAAAFPDAILITAVTLIAGFYFCIDGERVAASLCACLPYRIRVRLPVWRTRIRTLSWRYLRAYLLLLLMTFALLFPGFCILRVRYAFLLAVVIALVDMLPILGVGTVLIPWAVVVLLQKNYYLGFGLLILYAAVLILRQILEPRLVGHSLGISPILTLFSTYAGWKLLGFVGMILGPVLAMLGKTLVGQIEKRR